ncbi:MAG: Trx7/PDZ domain-containing (seleno)protein [Pirellula sp.]
MGLTAVIGYRGIDPLTQLPLFFAKGASMLATNFRTVRFNHACLALLLFATGIPTAHSQQTREAKVLADKKKFESLGLWYYNNLDAAFAEAKKTDKPLLVILRCIPCEECVKLDDDLVEADPTLQSLLKSFVRCRVVGTNGLDLSLFEFDTDQSFAVFIFNPDRTLYGRYGTRSSQKEWQDDVSVEGLGKALQGALELHRNYPTIKASLAGKQARKPKFSTPESIPSLATKFTSKLDYEGNVVKSCIHCHQIGDAMRELYRAEDSKGSIPESVLFPYPHPKSIGLILDPKERATVVGVTKATPAQTAGIQPGDQILALAGQPILSFADVQWVLEGVPSTGGSVAATIKRGSETLTLNIPLNAGWRTKGDISWRVSSWQLRRGGLGGMFMKPLTDEERKNLGIAPGNMALIVNHVGQFSPHDRAKRAGVEKGDVLIEYDGRKDLTSESDLLAYAINQVPVGRVVPMKFLRDKKEKQVEVATAP